MPGLLASREELTKKLLRFWDSYTHPSGHLVGARGYARVLASFNALLQDWMEGDSHEGEECDDHDIGMLSECWFASLMGTAHKIPSASPLEKLPSMSRSVPHAAADTSCIHHAARDTCGIHTPTHVQRVY